MIQSIRVVRETNNYNRMRTFYEENLDMRPLAEWDRAPDDRGVLLVFNGRTSTTSVEVVTMGARAQSAASVPHAAVSGISLSLEVDNVGAQYEAVVTTGIEITREPENIPWGHRSFSVTDPDGLEISFYQDMNR